MCLPYFRLAAETGMLRNSVALPAASYFIMYTLELTRSPVEVKPMLPVTNLHFPPSPPAQRCW